MLLLNHVSWKNTGYVLTQTYQLEEHWLCAYSNMSTEKTLATSITCFNKNLIYYLKESKNTIYVTEKMR